MTGMEWVTERWHSKRACSARCCSEAKVIAIIWMIVGVAFLAVITGALAERFIAFGEAETIDADARQAAGDDLGAQVGVRHPRTRDSRACTP